MIEADRAGDARREEEAALLRRIRRRDERALEELYQRYATALYSLAYQVTGGERYAQDVVQEVFIVAWRDAARFDPSRGSVGAWLFGLARHKAIDVLRRESTVSRRAAPETDLEFEAAPDDVARDAWERLRRERVLDALQQLPDAQRVCVELAFFSGLTHVEVSERLGIPLGTAKTRIRTGLLRLRDILGDSLAEQPAGGVA
ncbi:MAG: sigma-70 family RNA polymerase sigma factor [Candidatus Limnocylindrales bacterium]